MRIHIGILLILLILNLLPEKWANREKFILPFSFLVITVYWAIRYNYGLDYWNYYNLFYMHSFVERSSSFGERWFYGFTHLFPYYYQSIIAQSVIIGGTLYHLARKYISPKVYWLFFLLLFIVSGFHFNLISAQRSTMAAVIMYWGFDLFYISRRRWIPFIAMVLAAMMFHTSAIVFLVIPLLDILFPKISGHTLFIVLIISAFLSHTISNIVFNTLVDRITFFNDYTVYTEKDLTRGWSFIFGSLLTIVPWYYLCQRYKKGYSKFDKHFILAYTYQFITLIALNFQDRFTVYLFPFFIIILAQEVMQSDRKKKFIMLGPYFFYLGYALYWYYWKLFDRINSEWSSGNMFYYQTIFDAPSLP